MVLLASEAAGIYDSLSDATEGNFLNNIFIQFSHHPWNGLRFWDLIQPSFMFMAGTAMAYSLHKQQQQGLTWNESFRKDFKTMFLVIFLGSTWIMPCVRMDFHLNYGMYLTQLSFTTLVAFLIFRWSAKAQIIVCVGLLLLTEVLYRFTHVPGFDQPFVDQHNFGNYVDLKIMNIINKGGWVAINCIPTAVHTIAGALVGKLLLSGKDKIKTMIIAATHLSCTWFRIGLGRHHSYH